MQISNSSQNPMVFIFCKWALQFVRLEVHKTEAKISPNNFKDLSYKILKKFLDQMTIIIVTELQVTQVLVTLTRETCFTLYTQTIKYWYSQHWSLPISRDNDKENFFDNLELLKLVTFFILITLTFDSRVIL